MKFDLMKSLQRVADDERVDLHARGTCEAAIAEIERLQRCHQIIAKQVGYYKPELPDFTKIDIHLGVLRAAERCAGFAPWEAEEEAAALSAAGQPEVKP